MLTGADDHSASCPQRPSGAASPSGRRLSTIRQGPRGQLRAWPRPPAHRLGAEAGGPRGTQEAPCQLLGPASPGSFGILRSRPKRPVSEVAVGDGEAALETPGSEQEEAERRGRGGQEGVDSHSASPGGRKTGGGDLRRDEMDPLERVLLRAGISRKTMPGRAASHGSSEDNTGPQSLHGPQRSPGAARGAEVLASGCQEA
ncbi:unnamed protein product [Rangifer tarandus platyrhynchus]|uniref:Uncharacterized protein n=1 Tax=Rangifer tarandus platyrhynchus TaxID=3082113 RepID=A0AC59Z6P8_RANTA